MAKVDFLTKIRRLKEKEVESFVDERPSRDIPILDFKASITDSPIIAEVKLSSPSKGMIRMVDPVSQARLYRDGGCGAVSILTDSNYFGGSWENINRVKREVEVPVLCKEFIISEKQIIRAYNLGADAILLISELLSVDELVRLHRFARDIGLQVLLEFNDPSEIPKIEIVKPDMLGINSRNLRTLVVDKERSMALVEKMSDRYFVIAESGVESEKDIVAFTKSGARAFLIGEALMRSEDPAALIRRFTDVHKDLRDKGC